MRSVLLAALALIAAPAFAQSTPASQTSKQTSVAVGAIGESGLKVTSGVVTIPLGAAALTSGAVGLAAGASGHNDAARGFSQAAVDTSKGAKAIADFANQPLQISDEVIVQKPQPAPAVPYQATPR
jgi:hypothetical protein